jgi:hypothetical protein
MTGFQQAVAMYPAVGIWGARASMDPTAAVNAGQFNLTAGILGVAVGKFAWQAYTPSTGLGVINNFSPTVPTIPDGFIGNEQQALITSWLAQNGMVIPAGYAVGAFYNRGSFWGKTVYADAAIGNKVFANLFSGDIYPANSGAFVTTAVGSAASVTATTTAGSFSMNITATGSGTVAVGQQISGPGLQAQLPTYIESFGTYNGTAGTVNLTQAAVTASTGGAFTTVANVGIGGCTATSGTITSGSAALTMNAGTYVGQIAVGQQIYCATAGLPVGAYVSALGTSTGGAGTLTIGPSNATATITAQAFQFSAWIETPWYFLSAGNVGDLVKIGTRW